MSANGSPDSTVADGPSPEPQAQSETVNETVNSIRSERQGGRHVNIRPLHDRVVVRRIEQQEQVRGGIIIPDTAKEKPQEAEVVAVGPGKLNDDGKRSPIDVKSGDRILIGKYSGSEIKIGEEDFVILREDEILAVLE
jgi:chaperonin GroES